MSVYLLIALAIAPGLAISIYIYWKDQFDREPRRLLIYGFLLGVISIVPAITLEHWWGSKGYLVSANAGETAFYAWIVVGLSEELAKFALLRFFLYRKEAFNEPYDGITYAVMISMGFATLENIMYVMEGGISVAVMRAVLAVPAHATFGVIMGYFVGLAKFRKGYGMFYLLLGLMGAAFFHGLYDFSIMQTNVPELQVIGAVGSLIVAIILSRSAIRIHQKNSPFNPNRYE